MRVWPGQPYPLGATWDGQGVNFAIFSESATGVELCLFAKETDAVEAEAVPWHEQPFSATLTLPPLGAVWLVPE